MPVSMLRNSEISVLVSLPVLGLYEIGILQARRIQRRQQAEEGTRSPAS